MLLKKSPDYASLRVFGCLCSGINSKVSHKFDQRASPGIFVGYPHGQKGYNIFDLQSKYFYVSRDVVFHETRFVFLDSSISFPVPEPVHNLEFANYDSIFDSQSPVIVYPTHNSSSQYTTDILVSDLPLGNPVSADTQSSSDTPIYGSSNIDPIYDVSPDTTFQEQSSLPINSSTPSVIKQSKPTAPPVGSEKPITDPRPSRVRNPPSYLKDNHFPAAE